jgi:hypothetical protein
MRGQPSLPGRAPRLRKHEQAASAKWSIPAILGGDNEDSSCLVLHGPCHLAGRQPGRRRRRPQRAGRVAAPPSRSSSRSPSCELPGGGSGRWPGAGAATPPAASGIRGGGGTCQKPGLTASRRPGGQPCGVGGVAGRGAAGGKAAPPGQVAGVPAAGLCCGIGDKT